VCVWLHCPAASCPLAKLLMLRPLWCRFFVTHSTSVAGKNCLLIIGELRSKSNRSYSVVYHNIIIALFLLSTNRHSHHCYHAKDERIRICRWCVLLDYEHKMDDCSIGGCWCRHSYYGWGKHNRPEARGQAYEPYSDYGSHQIINTNVCSLTVGIH
jgi:hypothetical protein